MNIKNQDFLNMQKDMEKEVDFFLENFSDSPEKLSGWGHDYFCHIDGGALIFDYEKPHEHVCSVCGKIYTGIKYDQCWTYTYRYNVMYSLTKAAYLFKETKNKKFFDYIISILNFYSDNYKNFKVQAKGKIVDNLTIDVGGASKIMPQGLNEAIMLIRITNALSLIKSELDPEWIDKINENLFQPAINLLNPQRVRIHNIALWIGTAIASVALLTEDNEKVNEVYLGEFGIKNQIDNGFTDDGFWYEGSIHYNYFALEGVVNFLLFAELYNYNIEDRVKDKVLDILKAPYEYAFDNLMLPNPNDGWPNLGLKTYSFIYYIAYKIYGDRILDLIATIEKNEDPRTDVALSKPYYYKNYIPLERLLFAKDLNLSNKGLSPGKSKKFNNSSYVILKNNKVNIFAKSGHQTKSHAHPDKMNIEVSINGKFLTRDLSNPGYGSTICNEWNRESLSHNTVILNGKSHEMIEPGEIKNFTQNSFSIKSNSIYLNTLSQFERNIILNDNGFTDEFRVNTDDNKTKDWIFHIESEVLLKDISAKFSNDNIIFDKNGYQHLKEINKFEPKDSIIFNWDFYGKNLKNILDTSNKEVYIAKSYDNPANKFRTTIIVRSNKNQEIFKNIWIMEE